MNTSVMVRSAFRKAPFLGWFAVGLLLLSGMLLLAAGWKSEPTVTGMVRLDGQPLAKGSIRFIPVKDTTTGSGGGNTIHQGKYQIVKGLTAGKYKVEISGTRTVPGKKMRNPVGLDLIPAEEEIVFADYDQNREVGPGLKTYDFELKEVRKRP
jgi:hypothetical protein